MARRKAIALAVPASTAEAAALLADYVAADRKISEVQLVAEQVLDQVKAERDALIALVSAEQPGRFASLKAWWEAGGKDIAGKGRSAEIAGAKLGVRLTTPAVKFGKGWNGEKVVAWLSNQRWLGKTRFLRKKVELDKPAVIKAIGEPGVAKVFAKVLTVNQTDEFFIDTGIDREAIAKEISG